jgi:hypothetical protein
MSSATKRKSFLALVALGLLTHSASAASSDFERLLKNPAEFDDRRVTLIGVAEIGGDEFFLYPNGDARRLGDPAVFVARDPKGPMYGRFNNHWVRVTGIVNAHAHGPLGSEPCEIRLLRIEPLPRAPVADVNIYGVFRNDRSDTVTLKFAAPTGYSIFDLGPQSITPPGIIAHGSVEVTRLSGKLIAKAELVPRGSPERYFDAARRTYYYRIIGGRIDPVLPDKAKEWHIYWPAELGQNHG